MNLTHTKIMVGLFKNKNPTLQEIENIIIPLWTRLYENGAYLDGFIYDEESHVISAIVPRELAESLNTYNGVLENFDLEAFFLTTKNPFWIINWEDPNNPKLFRMQK